MLMRKGIGELHICDGDVVEASNLNRQHFFATDLYSSKAKCLARNVSRHSAIGSRVTGHRVDFNCESADELTDGIDLAYVGVDNNQTRAFASQYCLERGIPVIFSAVSETADYGWTFIQGVDHPCLGCVFPEAMRLAESEPRRCTPSPAALDILQMVGALTLYAMDSALMPEGRNCPWTFRSVSLTGMVGLDVKAEKDPHCPLCGTQG